MVKQISKKQKMIQFALWFIFLSTLGVGGGIFFLLFGVVPIEQVYVDRGWSQFRIDAIMKYYVLGWVVFGFIASFLYYYFIVKKKRWKLSVLGVICTILLCVSGLYYFMHTGNGVVQGSQGEIEEGERFTFGPYPEKEQLERLKEEGYDGVISLLSPTLPIEKPLLDKEKKAAKEAGLEVHSLPMLPWVGDNTQSIKRVKDLIKEDDKKYYVHCYLGRRRVDVIKQVVNDELGDDYKLMFLQPTTLERGSLYYFKDEEILVGPYPTDEEWFTRVKRAEVEEVISTIDKDSSWNGKENKVVKEIGLKLTHMPISSRPTKEEIKNIVEYARKQDHKIYIHGITNPLPMEMIEAYMSWGATIHNLDTDAPFESGEFLKVGQKLVIGFEPTEADKKRLNNAGVTNVAKAEKTLQAIYQQVSDLKKQKEITYLSVDSSQQLKTVKQISTGLLFGSMDRGAELKDTVLEGGKLIKHERNLTIGPILSETEYDSFAIQNGVAQIIFLDAPSTTDDTQLKKIKAQAKKRDIPMTVIPMYAGYEEELIPIIDGENGLNYIMTDKDLMNEVNDFVKQF